MVRPLRTLREPSTVTSSSSTSPERAAYGEDTDFFQAVRNDSQSSLGALSLRDFTSSSSSTELRDRFRRLSPISLIPPELLIAVFAKLNSSSDLRNCMLVSKTWARNSAEILWHRPLCNSWQNLMNVSATVLRKDGYFPYSTLIRRLNLSNLSDQINDVALARFENCKRIERLTLTGCKRLTDAGVGSIVQGSKSLLALDISGLSLITDFTLFTVAQDCVRLQGLNVTDCANVTDASLILVAQNCHFLKRLKVNGCSLLTDKSIMAVAELCPSMLEIDLHQCRSITNESITGLIRQGRYLRELRLGQCQLITDHAFLDLPKSMMLYNLRILDLTACHLLRDTAVEKIVDAAPRLRNLVLAKCREITDRAVMAITKLGKNLHYIHLGHCLQITDAAVIQLVKFCNRIRYIDLACCQRLTDASVKQLATLQKLRRIGLVKCQSITDRSILALAKSVTDVKTSRQLESSLLERVHLSYCVNLSIPGIHALLNHCPKLTHLSLTGVQAFYQEAALTAFCREAPPEFTEHQRTVFCVFSGDGVNRLRTYLNEAPDSLFDGEGPMFDDREHVEGIEATMTTPTTAAAVAAEVAAAQMAGLMHAAALNDDDEDMDELVAAEDSQDGIETDT